uniref:C2H2-type domain-containing protein n=1 Tax=Chelonoidis abingdonii TaxID=106734 RepID=A0A8C0GK74_CHEAB
RDAAARTLAGLRPGSRKRLAAAAVTLAPRLPARSPSPGGWCWEPGALAAAGRGESPAGPFPLLPRSLSQARAEPPAPARPPRGPLEEGERDRTPAPPGCRGGAQRLRVRQAGSGAPQERRNYPQCLEQAESWGSWHRSERLLGNYPGKKVDESSNGEGEEDPRAQQTNAKEETPWHYLQCGKGFIVRSQLVTHRTIHTGEKPLQCLDHGESFNKLSDLNNHGRSHTGEKPSQSLECGKCFISKTQIVRRQLSHTGERPHKRKSNLVEHQAIHTEERPHKCLDCGKSFIERSNLVKHQACHTKERLHKCLECGKSFIRKSHLVEHQAVHTGERPHKCLDCGKSFKRRSNLIIHGGIHTRCKLL